MTFRTAVLTTLCALVCSTSLAEQPALPPPDVAHWKRVYDRLILVRLDDTATIADVARVKERIFAARGTHVLALGTEAILASMEGPFETDIAALPHVAEVTRNAVSTARRSTFRPQAQLGAAFMNAARSGTLLDSLRNIPTVVPREGDARAPEYSPPSRGSSAQSVGLLAKSPKILQWDGHNAVMGGSGAIRVTIFLVESDGASEANEFSWTSSEADSVVNNIIQGLYLD